MRNLKRTKINDIFNQIFLRLCKDNYANSLQILEHILIVNLANAQRFRIVCNRSDS